MLNNSLNRNRSSVLIVSGLTIMALLTLWQLFVSLGIFDARLIPGPITVFHAAKEWIKSGDFYRDFSVSIWRGVTGLAIGTVIGIFLGFATGRNYIGNLILSPILNIIKAFPPVAIVPVFITFLGIGDISKIVSIGFATIFPIWINTHTGSKAIPIEFIRSARLLTKSKTKFFFRVIFPASLHSIMAGFRISIAIAFIMIYVSELAGASSGLGFQISNSNLNYRMDKMFAALLMLGLTASVVDYLFSKLVAYFFPWIKMTKVI